MSESPHLFPQIDRLLARIDAVEAPLIPVWGWPGSGRNTVLEALLERHGRRAVALPMAALASGDALREALESAHEVGVRWLVPSGEPASGRLAEVERWLRPGQRLVFATGRRPAGGVLPRGTLSPQELLLSSREIAALWHLLIGTELPPPAAQALAESTDGWYQPLRLAIESTGGAGLEGAAAEALLEVATVRLFFRHEVLAGFSEEDRELLLDAPEERPAAGSSGEEAWRLLDELGLWVEGRDRDRMPRLLAAALERERRRRRPAARPRTAAAPAPREEPAGVPSVYSLGLLGSPIARLRDEEGERDLDCRLRRAFQVLAYLASSPELQAAREELVEAVWSTEGERTIERNFHPTLSHLRRALEGGHRGDDRPTPLLFRNGVYRLNPEVTWEIDTIELNRLYDEGRERVQKGDLEGAVQSWRGAWRLYRGPFLQGYYESWVTARREAFQRIYLDLLRELGDLYVRLGRNEEAMDAFRTVLVEDQLQERIHVAIMRLYAQQGRRDLVRRQFDNLSRILQEELGVAPMPQTTREFHKLMA